MANAEFRKGFPEFSNFGDPQLSKVKSTATLNFMRYCVAQLRGVSAIFPRDVVFDYSVISVNDIDQYQESKLEAS